MVYIKWTKCKEKAEKSSLSGGPKEINQSIQVVSWEGFLEVNTSAELTPLCPQGKRVLSTKLFYFSDSNLNLGQGFSLENQCQLNSNTNTALHILILHFLNATTNSLQDIVCVTQDY